MTVEYSEYDQAKRKIPERWFQNELFIIILSTSSMVAVYT